MVYVWCNTDPKQLATGEEQQYQNQYDYSTNECQEQPGYDDSNSDTLNNNTTWQEGDGDTSISTQTPTNGATTTDLLETWVKYEVYKE